ncbi:hypothetical protein Sjap_021714 [Stephania japonica]|uniref:BTB domain-containing protein n=1 Tax=Stephania japonica TaxID=461633 RepID=A0AAP0EQM5_9MAGN
MDNFGSWARWEPPHLLECKRCKGLFYPHLLGNTTCKQCIDKEVSKLKTKEAENLKLEVEVLKREKEELESKVEFLRYSSLSDHDPYNPHDDWTSSYATDVVLIASDDPGPVNYVHAHKAILTNKSAVLRAMFRNEMEEKQTNTIKIREVSQRDLCAFVKYLYSAEVNLIDNQMAQNLLILGEKYKVNHLKARCENFLRSN